MPFIIPFILRINIKFRPRISQPTVLAKERPYQDRYYPGKAFFVLVFLLLLLSISFTPEDKCASVPVIPNESIIEGVVAEYAIISSRLVGIQPDQVLHRLTIFIENSRGAGDKPSFLKGKEGQDIQFYTKERLSPELFGKRIKAKVRYSADERGGTFWILSIEIEP